MTPEIEHKRKATECPSLIGSIFGHDYAIQFTVGSEIKKLKCKRCGEEL